MTLYYYREQDGQRVLPPIHQQKLSWHEQLPAEGSSIHECLAQDYSMALHAPRLMVLLDGEWQNAPKDVLYAMDRKILKYLASAMQAAGYVHMADGWHTAKGGKT